MNRFLADVEKRAFNHARVSVGNADDALDIVQDSMFTLVRRYADKPAEQWTPLFFRILHNRIMDHHRRQSVQRRRFSWWPGGNGEDGDPSPEERLPDTATPEPEKRQTLDDSMVALEQAVAELPVRQREAFLLRTLEGLDVAATARAMSCSTGSVKTHYHRATQTLRERLKDHWT